MFKKPLVRFEAVSGNIVLGGRQFPLFDVRKAAQDLPSRSGQEVRLVRVETPRNGKGNTWTPSAGYIEREDSAEVLGNPRVRPGDPSEMVKTSLAGHVKQNDRKRGPHDHANTDDSREKDDQDDIQICYDAKRVYKGALYEVNQKRYIDLMKIDPVEKPALWTTETSKRSKVGHQSQTSVNQRSQLLMTSKKVKIGDIIHEGTLELSSGQNRAGEVFLKEGLSRGTNSHKYLSPAMGRYVNVRGFPSQGKPASGQTNKEVFFMEGLSSGTTNNAKLLNPATERHVKIRGIPNQDIPNKFTQVCKDVHTVTRRDANVKESFLVKGFPFESISNIRNVDHLTEGDFNAPHCSSVVPDVAPLTGKSVVVEELHTQPRQIEAGKYPTAGGDVNTRIKRLFLTGSLNGFKNKDPATHRIIQVRDCGIEKAASVSYVIPETIPTGTYDNAEMDEAGESGVHGRAEDNTTGERSVAFCTICQVPWRSRSALRIHHQTNHLKFECRICSSEHSFQVGRIRHTSTVQTTTCFSCAIIFPDRDVLKEHAGMHKTTLSGQDSSSPQEDRKLVPMGDVRSSPITCGICGVILENRADRDSHMSRDHGFKYACGICFERFESLVSLSSHEELHSRDLARRGDVETRTEERTRVGSKPETPEWNRARPHVAHGTGQQLGGNPSQTCTSTANYICDLCSQLFVTWEEMYSHRQIHSSTSSFNDFNSPVSFSCEICKAIFCSKQQLDSHYSMRHTQNFSQQYSYPQFV